MKKLLLFAVSLFTASAIAQPDIKVTLVSPTSGISEGTQFTFEVKIENTGTEAIDAMDSIIYAPLINNQFIGNGAGGILIYLNQQAIPVGGSANVTQNLTLTGGSSGMISFCGSAAVLGAGWSGIDEADTTDNVDCANIQYTAATIGVSEWTVATPTTNNSYFANGMYFVDVNSFENLSNTELVVFNLAGQDVVREGLEFNSGKIERTVDLTSLPRGVYLVQIKSDQKIIGTQKVVAE